MKLKTLTHIYIFFAVEVYPLVQWLLKHTEIKVVK